jgi:N-acyl-phosphatidylethanolamine-hydrolysing phospholipase D
MKFIFKLLALAFVLWAGVSVLSASQSVNANFNAAKPHHTPEGFRNNYPHETNQNFWKWQWERWSQGVAPAPEGGWQTVLPSVKPDVAFLKANRTERTITWLGHATVLLQTGGVNIITDPVFSERTAPVQFAGPKRQVPFMMTMDELPDIDVVFISHNHYDHLDLGTIEQFKTRFPNAKYIVPLGLKAWFDELGVDNVRELDWWDVVRFGAIDYTFVPAQHWSKRSLSDTNRSLWGGIVIEDKTATPWRFIYTGDTGYSKDFKDIAAKFPGGFDWAAIPIGAYEPRWFMKAQHVNPDESVQILSDLGAKQALAVHWGAWRLTDEPLDQPPKDLAVALAKQGVAAERFYVFKNGESRRIP